MILGPNLTPSRHGRWVMPIAGTFDGTQRITLIITSDSDNMRIAEHECVADTSIQSWNQSGALGIRHGVTLVIDENVTLRAAANSVTNSGESLLYIEAGSRVILDGGTLGGFPSGGGNGGITTNSGDFGAYFIMNSGRLNGLNSTSGAFGMFRHSAFIMHGGTITANTTSNSTTPRAGGISLRGATTAADHGSRSFFMTGGSITGNTVAGAGASANAGAIIFDGAFQKTGGIIGPNANNSTGGNVRATAVAILRASGNNPTLANSIIRNAILDEDDVLFAESIKPASGTIGTIIQPLWGENNWE